MSDRALADIICRALIAIVVGIRKRYGLPEYHNIVIAMYDAEEMQVGYNVSVEK